MLLRALALLVLLCLPCRAARAVEVVLGVDGRTGYNSNVFYQTTDATGDGSVRLGPTVQLRDRTGQLTWDLRYRPSYEVFYTTRGIDSVYQLANGEIVWRPSAATELYANDTFGLVPIRSSTSETDQPGLLAQPSAIFTNSLVLQNTANAGVRHAFTPRWIGEASLSSSIADYQSSRYSDSAATSGQAYATYALFPTDSIGTGLGATRQTITQPSGDSSGSTYYQLFGIWNHEFSPTWSMRLNAGPTLVQPDSVDFQTTSQNVPLYARNVLTRDEGTVLSPFNGSSCSPFEGVLVAERCSTVSTSAGPVNANRVTAVDANGQSVNLAQTGTLTQIGTAPESAGSSLTYFANLAITKRWRWFEMTGTYVRNATNTSGFSQSLVTDTLTLTNIWEPSPVWRLNVTGLFSRRASSSKQLFQLTTVNRTSLLNVTDPDLGALSFTGAQAQGFQIFSSKTGLVVTNYALSAQLNRRITRSAYVYGRASYQKQVTSRTGLASSDVDRYQLVVGFRYEFDPIHILN